jgi:hypothetical protein
MWRSSSVTYSDRLQHLHEGQPALDIVGAAV